LWLHALEKEEETKKKKMPVTNNGKIPHSWNDRDKQRNSLVSGMNTCNKIRYCERMQVDGAHDLSRDFSI